MEVLCSIPIQIPVHRIRVTAKCLAIGGPVHTAVLRLLDIWGEEPEPIAEVLGLRIPHVEKLMTDLERGGESVEREFVLWVDHARRRVLPYTALTGVAVKPNRSGPFTLREDPPTPNMLEDMGLQAGLSWDMGLEGSVEVLDLINVLPDIRDHSLPHELRLPDTQLVIRGAEQGGPPFTLAVTQHGAQDPLLTRWARENFAYQLKVWLEDSRLVSDPLALSDLLELTGPGRWDTVTPDPRELRAEISAAAASAQKRFLIAAPDLSTLPAWLDQILTDVHERDVPVVLTPGKPELVPAKPLWNFSTIAPQDLPSRFMVLADDHRALAHSDPAACLDLAADPVRHHLRASTDQSAIDRLLGRFGLSRLRPSPPREQITPELVASMLANDVNKLRSDLPRGVRAEIQPEDIQFAMETIDRKIGRDGPTSSAHKTTAGIAWERVLIERVSDLTARHRRFSIVALRWKPPGINLDLDVIVHDQAAGLVWVLDGKNAKKTDGQLEKIIDQIYFLKKHSDMLAGASTIRGAIVHRERQLERSPEATERPDIVRCTLQGLSELMLAKRLPGEQPPDRPQAA
jgi:hypothetical protein